MDHMTIIEVAFSVIPGLTLSLCPIRPALADGRAVAPSPQPSAGRVHCGRASGCAAPGVPRRGHRAVRVRLAAASARPLVGTGQGPAGMVVRLRRRYPEVAARCVGSDSSSAT